MPKISIVTPVYCDTSAKVDWLDEMIQSVVNQSMTNWELILIDDKSPLMFGPVRLKHDDDKRIRWLENARNVGPAKTRNTAVSLAESECILPLDSDDMLANNEVLENMYDAWLMDRTKTIYGNVQLYAPRQDGFQRSKVHQLAHYSFEGAMNLQFGIMPVTTMHSKDAHYNAGGWKPALTHGREDLEYWIACGKAGFCGVKINQTTLLYRKHEQSRDYRLKFELKELETMQRMIKEMHSDIYRGEFPMACCGKSKTINTSVDPVTLSQQNQGKRVKHITALDGYSESELEWVAYRGPKQGSAGRILVRGPANLPSEYPIMGNGHVFQIHKRHRQMFSDRQKLGFEMDQHDPRQSPEPELKQVPMTRPEPQIIEVAKPELSTLVRLDRIGSETRETEVQEAIIEPNPADSYSDTMVVPPMPTDYLKIKEKYPLANLGLSDKLIETLDKNNWTTENLAVATPQKLSSLPGIGIKRANTIIAKAQELINNA